MRNLVFFITIGFSVLTYTRSASAQFLSHDEVVARLSARGPATNRTPATTGITDAQSIGVSTVNNDVDLRAFDSPVASQFGGTCSAFGTAAAMDNVLRARGIKRSVSRRDLWNQYAIADADYAVEAANKNYITELQYYPDSGTRDPAYQDKRSLRVSQFTHYGYDFEGAIRALDRKNPVVFAVKVPSDLSNCKAAVSDKSYATKGHHVLAAVGYHLDPKVAGGGYFILKNSWGTQCGDKGYHYYPFALCKRKDLYCYAIEINAVEAK